MLGYLHRDLYGKELRAPNEVARTIFVHQPELHIRKDSRRHLELVANRFDLNPQVRLCLFVEGTSEVDVVQTIFKEYFGFHPGVVGVEIVSLGGVGNATGGRFEHYAGMVRLIDYLHAHHTHTFLLLDNEGDTNRLVG